MHTLDTSKNYVSLRATFSSKTDGFVHVFVLEPHAPRSGIGRCGLICKKCHYITVGIFCFEQIWLRHNWDDGPWSLAGPVADGALDEAHRRKCSRTDMGPVPTWMDGYISYGQCLGKSFFHMTGAEIFTPSLMFYCCLLFSKHATDRCSIQDAVE